MRGHVRKRRTWEFIVDVGPHPVTGGRRQKSKSGFASKKEAESALHEFIRYVEGGGDPCPQRVWLAAYLDQWLEYQRARSIRPLTLETYAGYIRREIVPAIGGLEVAKLRPGHVRAVLTRMQRRGLSATTIAQARGVLSSALRQAVDDGLTTLNPVAAVKRPRIRRVEPHWPTPMQLAALLKVSRDTLWEVPILLATVTGARRSEILGISWEDVDLKTGTIAIRRGAQRLPGREGRGRVVFTPFKTRSARRLVQLPFFAFERVRRHRRDQLECRGARGTSWRDPLDELGEPVILVCERGDGFFLHPDSFTHAFKRLAALAGLHPSTRLHDVRHAVATELGRRGVHSVIVSTALGHASPAFTAAVYQHAWQEGPCEVAVALEEALVPYLTDVGNPLAREALESAGEQEFIAN
ncbi:MAG: tyrosine-type recombinase/integrase [Actinobacteria bacterium]|nr:tyrosine-type recombinase/integrase [Actinomycetota bacterium]